MSISSVSDTTEQAYRARWSWDEVFNGTHAVDCYPGNCPMKVYVRDGKVIREEQTAQFATIEAGVPDFNPSGCNKGACWSQQLYQGDRLMHPMRRVGPRGSGQWEQITWDEAANEIAEALLDAIESHGPESIAREGGPEPGGGIGLGRFLGAIGGRHLDLHASFNDFSIGLHETFGSWNPVSSGDDWFKSELILIWHMNPAFTRINLYHFMLEARYHGAEVVSISPDLNQSHMHADYFVPMPSGDDVPFALGMVQTILEEGLEDRAFIREQTDLPLLVRTDTNRYLRQADLEGEGEGVWEDQLYHWHPDGHPVKADRGHLLLGGLEVALEGSFEVTLADGSTATVEPVMARLRRLLDAEYTPERQQEITGVHPDVVRMLARKVAARKTNIMLGWNSCKYYHGDLIERAMCLVLGVSGNWGKFGTGIRSWSGGLSDGGMTTQAKRTPGIEGTEQILAGRDAAIAALQEEDPSLTEELAVKTMGRRGATRLGAEGRSTSSPMAWWWYYQTGHRERWNTSGWGDTTLPRDFESYVSEAREAGWWGRVEGPTAEHPPQVLIETGGNMMRRTRGGEQVLEPLWQNLKLIVSIDFRINATGLRSDILLPAAQHYEKLTFHIATPHVMHMIFSDTAAEPAGEAKAEWDIWQVILRAFMAAAERRGVTEYTNEAGATFKPAEALDYYTLNGYMADQEVWADEVIRDNAYIGSLPDGTDLRAAREKGFMRFTGWGTGASALAQASPWEKDRTHVPFRLHVEEGTPYPTYSRRAQFYIDHPWWLEAGEELPVHKPNPKAGGDQPLRMTSGHNRWSIHSMNHANPIILQTHRGEPLVEVSVEDARDRGVDDDDLIRVWNDISDFTVRAKVSPQVRPGQIVSYNGWDPHQYRNWRGANEIEAGMVKWIGFAGGYGHIQYSTAEWQPIPTDRGVPCDFEKAQA